VYYKNKLQKRFEKIELVKYERRVKESILPIFKRKKSFSPNRKFSYSGLAGDPQH
jgi:hypothetical protein